MALEGMEDGTVKAKGVCHATAWALRSMVPNALVELSITTLGPVQAN